MHVCMYVCVCVCVYVCMFVCMYACMYTRLLSTRMYVGGIITDPACMFSLARLFVDVQRAFDIHDIIFSL